MVLLAVASTFQTIAVASWHSPQDTAPNIKIVRRPTKCRIAVIPQRTPKKPRQVFMILYSKGFVTPTIVKKYV